jgi:hypothetical protein
MRVFTIVFILIACNSLSAQERTISGRLTSSEDGSPLPGVNIVIKGTTVGTITDVDGNYSINVPVGATLVFNFIGMQAREVVVTEDNLKPVKTVTRQGNEKQKYRFTSPYPIPRSLYNDTVVHNGVGVATLTDESPTYSTQQNSDPSTARRIRKRGNNYRIKTDSDPVRRTGYTMQFSTSFAIEQINKLPSFQNEFSQGRTDGNTIHWNGADQSEIFSWGPLSRTLEFDGSDYPFDVNGKLVSIGGGNGNASKNYDSRSFFKTGFSNNNEIMVSIPVRKYGTMVFDVENRTRSGVIPNARYDKFNFGASLKNFDIAEGLTANASVSFNKSKGNLVNRGGNLATIIGGVYRTPCTFDNANALSPEAARSSEKAYMLADDTQRSHAPGLVDNPNGLINELPDNEQLQRIIATVNLQYSPQSPFGLSFNGSVDQQRNTTLFGIAPGYSGYFSGRLTNRKDDQTFANSTVTANYSLNHYDGELKLSLSHRTDHTSRELNRADGFGFDRDSFGDVNNAGSSLTLDRNLTRTLQEIVLNAQYVYYHWINARLSNRVYFSNTLTNKQFTNFFPTGSLSINLSERMYINVDELKLYATMSRSIREAPLIYSNWSYGSSAIPIEQYNTFYEASELFFTNNIAPEFERKFETGIKFQSGRIVAEASYFNNRTKNFIAPVSTSEGFDLQNAARVKNYGGVVFASYDGYLNNKWNWGIDLKWTKYNSKVEEIYASNDWIALAGFREVQTVLAAGQPTGAIYGTSYVRNEEGKKVIGASGFPLEDTNLRIIGNPIPDWNFALSSYFQFRQFRVSFLLDFKRGGDIWNGTNSVLDYLGRSLNTADIRNTANYVFEGVDENGVTNIVPVDFYDPSKPLNQNRWVRYGWDGVGEDYIEDASSLRLSELVLSYSLARPRGATIKHVKVSLIGRNLFLFTPYSGVDPTSNLFGYTTGNGLDLFNTPSVRSYSAQLTIQI